MIAREHETQSSKQLVISFPYLVIYIYTYIYIYIYIIYIYIYINFPINAIAGLSRIGVEISRWPGNVLVPDNKIWNDDTETQNDQTTVRLLQH